MSDTPCLRTGYSDHPKHASRGYDWHRSPTPTFSKGQKVWLSSRNIITKRRSKKLDHKWLGPYRVLEPVGSHAYKLDLPPQMEIHPVFHVSLLHPHKENTIESRLPSIPPVTIVNGNPELKVSEILDSRTYSGSLQYRIRWVGLSASEDTWEDQSDIHAPDLINLIKEFHVKYPGRLQAPAERRSARMRREVRS